MMNSYYLLLVTVLISSTNSLSNNDPEPTAKILLQSLNKVLNFIDEYHNQINFDGLIGVVLTEAQLRESALEYPKIADNLQSLIHHCVQLRFKIKPPLPHSRYLLFDYYFTNPQNWIKFKRFKNNSLKNFGIYHEWNVFDVLRNMKAEYNGVPTDVCLEEVLKSSSSNCFISPLCMEMMLAKRNDTSYLLTHRLLYLQVVRLKGCNYHPYIFEKYANNYCSMMLKEARTNEELGFPEHDLFLEQMVFCGTEGYSEFLNTKWRNQIIEWQTRQGCFHSEDPSLNSLSRRSANTIAFGCTDHTTGLGAAALALNFKYILQYI